MPPKTASVEAELTETVRLSESALAGIPADIDEYKLIRAERLLQPGKSCGGPQCWRLTYKRKELVPETLDAEVGKGGEVFIEVDLQARSAQVTGYGE